MEKESKEKKKINFYESAYIIAILTSLIYFFSYFYKVFQYEYFDIPSMYVPFDLSNIGSTVTLVIALMIFALITIVLIPPGLSLGSLIDKGLGKYENLLKQKLGVWIIPIVVLAMCFFISYSIYIIDMSIRQFLSITFIGLVLFLVGYYLLKRTRKALLYSFIVLIVFLSGTFASYYFAYSEASERTYFYTVEYADKNYVIIDIYNKSSYILKEYDENKNEIKDSFRIIEMSKISEDILLEELNEPPEIIK